MKMICRMIVVQVEDVSDDDTEYDLSWRGKIFRPLEIELGTSTSPRISCANHRCYIATRK